MSDQDSRKFQFPQVYIVEASAGSGKTYALAKRYIQLLINPIFPLSDIPLKNILAITFTNKAMIEMKERILEFLKKIALDQFSTASEKEDILSSLHVDEASARMKAHAIMDSLIKNYNFFQVQTIDSFINAILSGCAFKLNLSAAFKIKTDYRDYLTFSLDRLIDRAAHEVNVRGLFHHFLMQYLHLENRGGWFPKRDILRTLQLLFFTSNKFIGTFVSGQGTFKDLATQKKNILKKMQRLKNILPAETHSTFEKTLFSFIEEHQDTFGTADLSTFFSREDFPITQQGKISMEVKKLWSSLRRALRDLVEAESGFVFNAAINIFQEIFKDFRTLSHKEDVLFLEELNKQARGLFEEGAVTVPELYYRLATRLKHFLIDEFQDTSRLQWENLFLMVEEALATGGSLFYVGDKKQAIYRFRGGEVLLFDFVRERFKDYNVITEHLAQNYRSQKALVEFSNKIFSSANLKLFLEAEADVGKNKAFRSGEVEEILKVFEGAQQRLPEEKNAGYVNVAHVDSKNKDERNHIIKDKVIALIEGLKRRGFQDKDIALLTRKNDDVELLTAWLLGQGIPVESEKTLNIRHNAYIKELISFLKFLNSPIDNVSFASFICGEIFSKATKIAPSTIHDFIFKSREKQGQVRSLYLYREFRRHFPDVWDNFIEEFFQGIGFVPLYELTISILKKFTCFENFGDYQGFFMRFLELIKEQEEDRPSFVSFLEYFDEASDEELYLKVAETNAVKILTIHKAKGLGFPVVILPFLEMNVKVAAHVTYAQEGALVLKRINERYRLFSPSLEEDYRREYLKSFLDELNSIYVAVTRAKEELYIFIPRYAEKGINLARRLIPEEFLELGKPTACVDQTNSPRDFPPLEIPASRYQDWIQFLKDEFMEASVIQQRQKILKGEVFHSILSLIGNLDGQEAHNVLKDALEKTKMKFPLVADFRDYETSVKRLLSSKNLEPFFFVKEGTVYQEKEIVNAFGDTKRIDRLVITADKVWIIDYKSSRENQQHDEEQVQEYRNLIRTIYPDKDVKGALIYLDDFSMKEVHGTRHDL